VSDPGSNLGFKKKVGNWTVRDDIWSELLEYADGDGVSEDGTCLRFWQAYSFADFGE